MTSKLMKRSVSLFLCVVFLVAEVASFAPQGFAQAFPEKSNSLNENLWLQSLPEDLGKIASSCLETSCVSPSEDAPFVLHIQDVHSNPEAQETIRKTLFWIKENAQKNNQSLLIALEGAAGPIHPEYFDFFPDYPRAGQAVVDHLFERGEITGAEKFAWEEYLDHKDSRTPAVGVETYELYRSNLSAYQAVAADSEKIKTGLDKQKMLLQKQLSNLSNTALKKFLQSKSELRDGHSKAALNGNVPKENWQAYFPVLKKESLEYLQIDLMNSVEKVRFPNLFRLARLFDLEKQPEIDSSAASQEWSKVLNQAGSWVKNSEEQDQMNQLIEVGKRNGYLKAQAPVINAAKSPLRENLEKLEQFYTVHGATTAGFKAFWQSLKPMVWTEEINFNGISSEMDLLENAILNKLSVSKQDKQLVEDWKSFSQISKLLHLELSEQDYKKLKQDSSYLREQLSGWNLSNLQASFDQAVLFYEYAQKRDLALVENALSEAKKTVSSQKLQKRPLVVLISGGFHSAGIQSVMKSKNIPHSVLTPRFLSAEKTGLYEKVMSGEGSRIRTASGEVVQFSNRQQGLLYKSLTEVAVPWMKQNAPQYPKEKILEKGFREGNFWKNFFNTKLEPNKTITLSPKNVASTALVAELGSGQPQQVNPFSVSDGGAVSDFSFASRSEIRQEINLEGLGTPHRATAMGVIAQFKDNVPEVLIYQVKGVEKLKKELDKFEYDFLLSLTDSLDEEEWAYVKTIAEPIVNQMNALIANTNELDSDKVVANPIGTFIQRVDADREANTSGLSKEQIDKLLTALREKALTLASLVDYKDPKKRKDEEVDLARRLAEEELIHAEAARRKVYALYERLKSDLALEQTRLGGLIRAADQHDQKAPSEDLRKEKERLQKESRRIGDLESFYGMVLNLLTVDIYESYLGEKKAETLDKMVSENRSFTSIVYEEKLLKTSFPARRRVRKMYNDRPSHGLLGMLNLQEEMIKAISLYLSEVVGPQGYSSETFYVESKENGLAENEPWILYLDRPLGIAEAHKLWLKYGKNIAAIVSTSATLYSHWVLIMKNFKNSPLIGVLPSGSKEYFKGQIGTKVVLEIDSSGVANVVLNPSDELWDGSYAARKKTIQWRRAQVKYANNQTKLGVHANLSPGESHLNPGDIGGNGSGLIRTEDFEEELTELFLEYIDSWDDASGETRLHDAEREIFARLRVTYKNLMTSEALRNKPATFRTFDLAWDKNKSIIAALRQKLKQQQQHVTGFNLYRTEIGKKILILQLSALNLEFIEFGFDALEKLRIMFPMVAFADDMKFLKDEIYPEVQKLVAESLEGDNITLSDPSSFKIDYGIMIERLDAVTNIDGLLGDGNSHFASVGTNDLFTDKIQQRLGGIELDRDSPQLIKHLGVLDAEGLGLIVKIIEAVNDQSASRKQVPLSFCGDLASQPKFLLLLDYFRKKYPNLNLTASVAISAIGPVKYFLSLIEDKDIDIESVLKNSDTADTQLTEIAAKLIEASPEYKGIYGETSRSEIREQSLLPTQEFLASNQNPPTGIDPFLGEEVSAVSKSVNEIEDYLKAVLGENYGAAVFAVGPDIHIRLDQVPQTPAIWEPLFILVQSVKGQVFFNLGRGVDLGKFDLFKKAVLQDLTRLGFQVDENRWNVVPADETTMPSAARTNKALKSALLGPLEVVKGLAANKGSYRFRLDSAQDEGLLVEQLVSIVHALALKSQLPDSWMEIQDPKRWANALVASAVQNLTAYLKIAVSA